MDLNLGCLLESLVESDSALLTLELWWKVACTHGHMKPYCQNYIIMYTIVKLIKFENAKQKKSLGEIFLRSFESKFQVWDTHGF